QPLDLAQDAGRSGPSESGVAQRTREGCEGRGPDEEAGLRSRKMRQHLRAEVLGDVPLVAIEGGRRSPWLPSDQRRQVQPRGPALGPDPEFVNVVGEHERGDRKSTRLNSSHEWISYAVFCLKKK